MPRPCDVVSHAFLHPHGPEEGRPTVRPELRPWVPLRRVPAQGVTSVAVTEVAVDAASVGVKVVPFTRRLPAAVAEDAVGLVGTGPTGGLVLPYRRLDQPVAPIRGPDVHQARLVDGGPRRIVPTRVRSLGARSRPTAGAIRVEGAFTLPRFALKRPSVVPSTPAGLVVPRRAAYGEEMGLRPAATSGSVVGLDARDVEARLRPSVDTAKGTAVASGGVDVPRVGLAT